MVFDGIFFVNGLHLKFKGEAKTLAVRPRVSTGSNGLMIGADS